MDDQQASRSSLGNLKALAAALPTRLSGALQLQRGSTKAIAEEDEDTRSETTATTSTPDTDEVHRSSMDSPLAARGPALGEDVSMLPWEIVDENGDVMEVLAVREKILDIAVFRRTFVDPAAGEEEYIFQYPKYKHIIKELVSSNPILREKLASLVHEAPSFVITEEVFWRNFFLRCNALRVELGLPPYLPEVKATMSSVAALASFQRFKRGVLLRKRRSTDGIVRMRRNLLSRRSASADSADPTAARSTFSAMRASGSGRAPDVDLGELDLDLDGEIERELIKRRPSRTVEPVGWSSK